MLLVMICIAARPVELQAQNTVTISGVVTDAADGSPLIGATVLANDGEAGALTDGQGRYTIAVNPADSVKLRYTYTGYLDQTFTVALPPGGLVHNLKMKVEAVSGDEVVITAGKIEQKIELVTVSIETIKQKALDVQASSDIIKSLEQTIGVTVNQNQVSLRGSSGFTSGSGSRVMIMLNSLPILSGDGGDPRFDMLPTDNIQSIEVVKGASSVLYGTGALGGVINVISKRPGLKPYTSIRVRGELYDNPANPNAKWDTTGGMRTFASSLHLVHSRKIKNLDFTVQTDLTYDKGYRMYEGNQRLRTFLMTEWHNQKIHGLSYGVNVLFAIDSSGFFLGWRGDRSNPNIPLDQIPYTGNGALMPPDGDFAPGYQPAITRTFNTYLVIDPKVTYTSANGNVHRLNNRFFMTVNDGPQPQLRANAYQYMTEYQYVHKWADWLTTIQGINYLHNVVTSDSIYKDNYQNAIAAFVQAEATFGRLNLSGGVRYQYDNINGNITAVHQPLFRAGANFRIHKATFLRASFGQALRNPSVRERFTQTVQQGLVVKPNPDIQIEKGYNLEVGVKQLFMFGSWKGMVDAALFRMVFKNMIEYVIAFEGALSAQPRNVTDAEISGFEITAGTQGKIGPVGVDFNAGYTYINPINPNGSKEQDGDKGIPLAGLFTTPDVPYTLKYRNRHTFRSSLTLDLKEKTFFTVNYRYTSEMVNVDKLFMYFNAPGAAAFREVHKGYSIIDLVLSQRFKFGTVSAHVFNLTNAEYMSVPGYLGRQRSYALQYKLEF